MTEITDREAVVRPSRGRARTMLTGLTAGVALAGGLTLLATPQAGAVEHLSKTFYVQNATSDLSMTVDNWAHPTGSRSDFFAHPRVGDNLDPDRWLRFLHTWDLPWNSQSNSSVVTYRLTDQATGAPHGSVEIGMGTSLWFNKGWAKCTASKDAPPVSCDISYDGDMSLHIQLVQR